MLSYASTVQTAHVQTDTFSVVAGKCQYPLNPELHGKECSGFRSGVRDTMFTKLLNLTQHYWVASDPQRKSKLGCESAGRLLLSFTPSPFSINIQCDGSYSSYHPHRVIRWFHNMLTSKMQLHEQIMMSVTYTQYWSDRHHKKTTIHIETHKS